MGKTYSVVKSGRGFRIQVRDVAMPEGFQIGYVGGARSRRFFFHTWKAAQAEADKSTATEAYLATLLAGMPAGKMGGFTE